MFRQIASPLKRGSTLKGTSMDNNNGLYNYTSLNDLWTLTSTVRAAGAAGMTAINAD